MVGVGTTLTCTFFSPTLDCDIIYLQQGVSIIMNRAVLFVILFLSCIPIHAQVITASVEGLVTDPGRRAPSPTPESARCQHLDQPRSPHHHGRRRPLLFSLAAARRPYSITVEAAGFNTEERTGITLEVNQAARLDFTLKSARPPQPSRSTRPRPLVESSTAAMGQVITSQSIADLPLNQRNAYSLVFLAPGVQGDVSFTYNSANFSINGGRPGTTDILVDGVPSAPESGQSHRRHRRLPLGRRRTGVQSPDQLLLGGIRPQRQRHHQSDL